MSEFFIYILILFSSVSLSNLSFSYSKVIRTFYAFGKSVPEISAICFDESGNRIVPYFSKSVLEEKTELYFLANLGGYDYSYRLVYPSVSSDIEIRSFSLSFSSDIGSFFYFSKKADFSIREGMNYGA